MISCMQICFYTRSFPENCVEPTNSGFFPY